MLPQIVEMAKAGSGIDLISRPLGIGAEAVRNALHLHRMGKQPPGRADGRRRRPRQHRAILHWGRRDRPRSHWLWPGS